MTNTSLADRVRWARGVAGVTQERLAKLCGISGPHVSLIESGGRTDLKLRVLVALAQGLGVSMEWLATGAGDPPTEEQIRQAIAQVDPKEAA